MLLLFIKRKGDALTCYHGATDAYMLSGEFSILAQGMPLKKFLYNLANHLAIL
jgi:hypothetical protein